MKIKKKINSQLITNFTFTQISHSLQISSNKKCDKYLCIGMFCYEREYCIEKQMWVSGRSSSGHDWNISVVCTCGLYARIVKKYPDIWLVFG